MEVTTLSTYLDFGCIGEQSVDVGYLFRRKDIGGEQDAVTIYSVLLDGAEMMGLLPAGVVDDLRCRCFEDFSERFGGCKCTTP